MANDSATKAYPLNLGEALHVELGEAGVDVTVLAPLVVNTGVVARMGIDAVPMPAEPISAEQAVDEAFTALSQHEASTATRAELIAGYEGIKAAVIGSIKERLDAAQAAH